MLSKDYTVKDVWREAIRDLMAEDAPFQDKYLLINRILPSIAMNLFDAVYPFYMEPSIISNPLRGKYAMSVLNQFTVSTSTLTIVNPSANLTDSDTGKMVTMRHGTSIYVGEILTVYDANNCRLRGYALPVSNLLSIDIVLIANTTVTTDVVSLNNLRMMRMAGFEKIDLYSSATDDIVAMSFQDLKVFRPDAAQNIEKIAFSLVGDDLYLKKGKLLTDYGILTFYYPRIPYLVSRDTDKIDLPDGIPIEILIMHLRYAVGRRLKKTVEDPTQKTRLLIEEFYKTLPVKSALETIDKKMEAIR